MANTTWNPSDKTTNVALTGSNLIATQTASSANGGARGAASLLNGKYYWECTYNVATIISTGAGIARSSAALNLGTGVNITALVATGTIRVDGSNAVISGVSITSGSIVGIAFDLGTGLIWFRVGAAGNWNYSATANPATGVGGLASGMGRVVAAYPVVLLGALNDQITANFGDSAFNGAVPSGFTSGFPVGIAGLLGAVTQVGVEEWGQGAPAAQVTQTALEVWGGITAGARSALVTQLAIEQWAPVAVPPATAAQYSVTVNSS